MHSFEPVQNSDFFHELPMQLQNKILKAITKKERKFFASIFKDVLTDFKIPTKLLNQLLACIVAKEVYFDELLFRAGDEINDFYMIKRGEVKLFDVNYDYMYHLGEGSYFGMIENMFRLTSGAYIKASLPDDIMPAYKISHQKNQQHSFVHCLLFKIGGQQFLDIISRDFFVFNYAIQRSLSRFRFNQEMLRIHQDQRR